MATVTQHKLEVGTRLKTVIQASGKSNTAWAEKFGRKKQNVTEWIKGRSYPDIEVMIEVCEQEGLTLDWIFRGVLAGVSVSWADRLSRPKQASPAASKARVRPVRETEKT